MSSLDHLQRIPARLPVLVTLGEEIQNFFTAQIGVRGVFIVTPTPRQQGQRLSLTLSLPDGQLFEAPGVVARTVDAAMAKEQGIPSGMGVQFYGLSPTALSRWERFLKQAHQRMSRGAPPVGWGPTQQSRARPMQYQLGVSSVEKLNEFKETALQANGVFIRTVKLCPIGTSAVISVVHPMSADEFHLHGVVVSVSEARGGVGVKLNDVSQQTLEDFKRFIVLGIPVIETMERKISHQPFDEVDDDFVKTRPRPISRETAPKIEEERETTIEITDDDVEFFEGDEMSDLSGELVLDFESLVIDVASSANTSTTDDGVISVEIKALDEEALRRLDLISEASNEEDLLGSTKSNSD